jgi:hypothetical protein
LKYERKDETQETANKILAYLMANPDAKDTLEGILDWWLLQQDLKRNIALVRTALDELIDKKFLLERKGNDRQKYYQVNHEKLNEIATLIKN